MFLFLSLSHSLNYFEIYRPLAKKLKDCGVFGPSSDEFLTYAMDNRSEWQAKGESIVEDMVACSTNKSEELSLLGD